jgi:hypothetical protein
MIFSTPGMERMESQVWDNRGRTEEGRLGKPE